MDGGDLVKENGLCTGINNVCEFWCFFWCIFQNKYFKTSSYARIKKKTRFSER